MPWVISDERMRKLRKMIDEMGGWKSLVVKAAVEGAIEVTEDHTTDDGNGPVTWWCGTKGEEARSNESDQ